MKYRLIFIAITLIAAVLAFPTAAYAHRPVWGEDVGVTKIENLSTSFAFYREFKTEKVHAYSFEGKTGQSLHAGIQIPAIKGLEAYSVSMAILGPGFPEVDEALLPPNHPENLGALIFLQRPLQIFLNLSPKRITGAAKQQISPCPPTVPITSSFGIQKASLANI
jgi:hypothetical protein